MDTSSKITPSGKSTQSGRGKNKRFWKREEEEALVNALVELSGDPKWKAEGNFKNGYMDQLQLMVNQKIPNCRLKVNPYIESKVKWFKDKYNALNDMLGKSGFSWDDENKMVKCERKVYEDFCKGNKNAQGLWRFSFPFLEQLDLVFGPDRATGDVCENVEDTIRNMENEALNLEKGEVGTDDTTSVNENSSLGATSRKGSKDISKDKGKKKMRMSNIIDLTPILETMSNEFSSYMKDMTTHLSTIASAMSVTQQHEQALMVREQELAEKKKNLLNEVMNIPGLTRFEAMSGAKMLASDPNSLEIFFQTPDDRWKKEFILGMIGKF